MDGSTLGFSSADAAPVSFSASERLVGVVVLLLAAMLGNLVGSADARPVRANVVVDDGVFASTTTAWVDTGATTTTTAKGRQDKDDVSGDYWVRAECFKDGTIVYRQYERAIAGSATLTLGPTPSWSSGAASCTADLGEFSSRGRWRTLDTTNFDVAA